MNVVTFLPPAKATHLGGSRVSRPVRRRHRSKRQTRHDPFMVWGSNGPSRTGAGPSWPVAAERPHAGDKSARPESRAELTCPQGAHERLPFGTSP
jgi:hypothetical protein